MNTGLRLRSLLLSMGCAGFLWNGTNHICAADLPVRVLLFSGQNNHDWRQTTPKLKSTLTASGRFAVDVTERPDQCNAATFARYDVIVSDWNAFPTDAKVKEWPAQMREDFLNFVRQGGGYVIVHSGGSSFEGWREYRQLGGGWGKVTGHGPIHSFEVKPVDPDHPITRGLKPFQTADELWHRAEVYPTKVLATAFSAKDKGGSGADEPVAFVTEAGQGRCFTLLLGHDTRAMEARGFQALLVRGTEWAATGKVTFLGSDPVGAADNKGFHWEESATSLALLKGTQAVWRAQFDRQQDKPFLHPIALPDGTELTALRPVDHPWHLAGWWSWKFIDGLNYWEPDPQSGQTQGQTEILNVRCATNADLSARIEMELGYRPRGGASVLKETRALKISAPDVAGTYRIDWTSTFTSVSKDVVLARTPILGQPDGVAYGGYAGLSLRMTAATRSWTFANSEGAAGEKANHGKPARWLDFSGKTPSGGAGGIAILDHPDNLRHPSPWYVNQDMPYFSPALLFNGSHILAAGTSLTLRYRMVIHTGNLSRAALDQEWQNFRKL